MPLVVGCTPLSATTAMQIGNPGSNQVTIYSFANNNCGGTVPAGLAIMFGQCTQVSGTNQCNVLCSC